MVRQGAVLPGGDDRGERRILRPHLPHALVRREHDVALGPPHQVLAEHPLIDLVGDARGLGDRGQLGLVLVTAKALHKAARGHQLDALRRELGELA